MNRSKTKAPKEQKKIGFARLTFQALPEMWTFQLLASLVLAIPTSMLKSLISRVAEAGGGAVSTANLKSFLLSWRAPVVFLLTILMVLCVFVMELLAKIHLCDDILSGRRAGIFSEIKKGLLDLRKFFSTDGIVTLIYILFAVPLCGVGFSLSLTSSFYIPNFIMSVVEANPVFAVGYLALLLFFIYLAYKSAFKLHAVLIDGRSIKEGQRLSQDLIKQHGKAFLITLLKTVIAIGIIRCISYFAFTVLPDIVMESAADDIPKGMVIEFQNFIDGQYDDTALTVVVYRFLSAFFILMGQYLDTVVALLCTSFFILRYTRCYMDYTRGTTKEYPQRPKKSRYYTKIFLLILVFILVIVLSVFIALFYNLIFDHEPVKIVAHRTGGTMASENSLEGLYEAIDHGCYGSETDTQRTKDGYYIINHDDNFKRLTGVNKTPQSMTLEEVRALEITDTTGSGAKLQVPMLEEMLDIIKGKEKLFIELKGATADQQMADDVIRMVREKDCVEDVVIISLKYDVISYTETTYPEFETGLLLFGAIGDISRLNCDILIMEEETATDARIAQIHQSGKQAIVWTVNTEDSMYTFLNSRIDAIITDEIEMAQSVQERLDARSEYNVMSDFLKDFWN